MDKKITDIAKLINECAVALNIIDHKLAIRILDTIDQKMNNQKVPLEYIFQRLMLGAELSVRLGKIEKSITEIRDHLQLFDNCPEKKFRLLIKAGRMEAAVNRLHISTEFISQALGLAEALGNRSFIAEAYSAISHMFAPKYPGLAFYFIRKAELSLLNLRDYRKLDVLRLDRALYSHVTFLRNRTNTNFARFENEALRLIQSISVARLNPHEIRYYKYIKAFIELDERGLETLIEELDEVEALPDKCRYGEVYLAICFEKGLMEKASMMLEKHKKNVIRYHGFSQEVNAIFNQFSEIIRNGKPAHYIPFAIEKPVGESTTIFDLLDKYSMADECWALDNGPLRILFPSYEHEGKFDAIEMPDGLVRLFPCGIAFNVYYRGQSEFFNDCKPSLYRRDVSDSQRFVERLKYEELKKVVDDYPLTEIFKSHIHCQMPDGKEIQLSLAIDYLALAQHYGIKTELMDLTTDKFVAAFFATTECHNDNYYPITEHKNKPGVLYRYSDMSIPLPNAPQPRLRAVGLQPFSRPGEQAGLVYEMEEKENFNDIVCSTEFFTHNKDQAEFIFNYTNRSKKLFPDSPLHTHAIEIRDSKVFSKYSLEEARKEFYQHVADDLIYSYLKKEGITISSETGFCFSDAEKNSFIKEWNNGGQEQLLDRIIVRPILRGDDTPIYGHNAQFK